MTFTFRDPDPPAQFKPADNAGEVILVIHGGYHPAVPTREYGIKPAARGTVVVLTGKLADTVIEDVVFFGARQSSQFKNAPGGDVLLCRIVKDGRAINYEPGSAYDRKVAEHWIENNTDELEVLRDAAVRNFAEQCARVDEALHGTPTEPADDPWAK